MKKNLLYINNFYGTQPLNYIEEYFKKSRTANLTIIKLPAVRSAKYRINIDAFVRDEKNKMINVNLNLIFPFPYFLVFIAQYIINFVLLIYFLTKIERKYFHIVIAETNFGGSVGYLLKKLGKVKFSIFFNGDILPNPKSSTNCFFLPNVNSKLHFLYKLFDTCLITLQFILRKICYKNDLVWFASEKIEKWDLQYGLKSKEKIIFEAVIIDSNLYKKYAKTKVDMNTICYLGRLDDYVGLDIVIPSLKYLKQELPNIQLLIVGGNELTINKYKTFAQKYDVTNQVKFYGYLPKMDEVYRLISNCALGLALYKPVSDNVSMYTTPGKLKDYLKVGLPILITKNGPDIGQEIVRYNAGLAIDFDIKKTADTIRNILTNERLYKNLKRGVDKYVQEHKNTSQFSHIWQEILQRYYVLF